MRYTYLFKQISRVENGELIPVTDKPNEFLFTFGKKIETFLDESPDDAVLLTKDMWKEYPTKNEEILPTVCFSTPSQQGFRRPLIMTKEADKIAGVYKYEFVYSNEIKDGKYLSDDLRRFTETFVNGVRAVNNNAMPKSWGDLENVNVKRLMSYIKSYVYIQLLQDRDNRGKERSKDFLKKVLKIFFSLIPDSIIKKFDEGLEAHDKVREKLEGISEDDTATIKAVLKSQSYFNTYEDFKLFVILRKYILGVKNRFNHLVWVMYRSKIGMVSLKNVKTQLSAMFEFEIKVKDNSKLKNKEDALKEICGINNKYLNTVKGFLDNIHDSCEVKYLDKRHQAALCYMFQDECDYRYINSRFKCWNKINKKYKSRHREEFRDLCLQYWKIEGENKYKPNKCEEQKVKFSSDYYKTQIWNKMKK